MNHQSWNDDNDFLSGALRGAADEMPGAEVDDLHVSYGVVRDRVRRRRAAKIGGLAGASLALVGGIAFGVTQSPLLGRSEPVLPGSPSQFVDPDAPTVAPDRVPTLDPDSGVSEGLAPGWLEGTGLTCGMPVSDLAERASAGEYRLEVRGDLQQIAETRGETQWAYESILPVNLVWETVDGADSSPVVPPVLVWSLDGQVVDLGDDRTGAELAPVEPEGRYSGAMDSDRTSCSTSEAVLPDGAYDVRALTEVHPGGGQEPSLAVSEPVTLTIEDGAVHQNPGTTGAAPFEIPESADDSSARTPALGSAVVDRTGAWERDVTYSTVYDLSDDRQWYPEDGEQYTIEAACTSTDPADVITFRAAGWLTSEGGGVESVLPCDGTAIATPVLTASSDERQQLTEVGAVRSAYLPVSFIEVPDGVTLAYAVVQPAPADGGGTGSTDAAAACSADGLGMVYDPANSPSEGAGATAQAIVEAALACDSDQLIELATQYPTELMFIETAEQTFALPDTETQHYRTLVALLAGTRGAVDPDTATVVWPRVSTEEFRDSNEAWQEVVDAGLLTQEQADEQRADETFGYAGMVIGIGDDGTWRYYSADD
jgi:hypothetical protein